MTKEFVVLGFDSRELAEEARSLGAELDRERVLQLDGAALAYRRDDGRVELVQPMRLPERPVGGCRRSGSTSGSCARSRRPSSRAGPRCSSSSATAPTRSR